MGDRPGGMGDMRHITNKITSKYDADQEAQVIHWFKVLDIAHDLEPGMMKMKEKLSNGVYLCKLVNKVFKETPTLPAAAAKIKQVKFSTLDAPFKKMENIQNFINACEAYGVPKTGTFQTVDLFEGRNMPQVLNCILALGSEAQRNEVKVETIGPKPAEKNVREFTDEQLQAGKNVIGLQAGSNKGASQSGMSMGSGRHITDIKVDEMSKDGQGVIGLQAGSNKGATQSGMAIGSGRHITDVKCDQASRESQGMM